MAPAQDEEFVLSHSDNVQATGFVEHLKLPHYVDFQSELVMLRRMRAEHRGAASDERWRPPNERARLQLRLSQRADQADDPPRHPQGDRDSRLSGALRQPRDAHALWLGHRRRAGDGRRSSTPDDALKVIDQGADDTTNAVSIRKFFVKTAGVATTDADRGGDASSRPATAFPRRRCAEDQILVFQVPIPEPLRFLEPRETETRKMHALEEYGVMHVKLYEDIARYGQIATTYAYPVEGRRTAM